MTPTRSRRLPPLHARAGLPRISGLALALALAAATAAFAGPPASPHPGGPPHRPMQHDRVALPRGPLTPPAAPTATALAADAVREEEQGAYGLAAVALRTLRTHTGRDADLELALALDEARAGYPDSAYARLHGALLAAALADSARPERWHDYDIHRDRTWLTPGFDGWYWYVARARAELALRLGHWDDALAAARIAARAQPLSGRDHLLLALAAGRAGDEVTARREAGTAAWLDPLLPEAHYLHGLWAWRAGDRGTARAAFEAAIARDSSWRPPALALVRLRLPASRPDTLPGWFLTRARRIAELTSPERPKPEENLKVDAPAGLYGSAPSLVVPDSLQRAMHMQHPIQLYVTLLVDERGRGLLDYFPYFSPESMPPALLHQVLGMATTWRFRPAARFGQPVRAWVSVEFMLLPS